MKTTTINGISFEKANFEICKNGKTLFDLYKNPSKEKIDIYNYWNKELDIIYWVKWNYQLFTIFGRITDENWERHYVKILKERNLILN